MFNAIAKKPQKKYNVPQMAFLLLLLLILQRGSVKVPNCMSSMYQSDAPKAVWNTPTADVLASMSFLH